MNERSTDERVADIKKGLSDPDLLSKIFQFGRYMLVSSSREGANRPTCRQDGMRICCPTGEVSIPLTSIPR